MEFNLRKTLKALLFSSSQPFSVEDVQKLIKKYHIWASEQEMDQDEDENFISDYSLFSNVPQLLPASVIRQEIEALQKELEDLHDVYRINNSPDGYYIVISSEYSDWIRIMRNEKKPSKLSRASLETLAIIAYRQPVTRAEMENIRGVSVDGPIHKLLELDLVCVCGKSDLPGRPLQYGTTDKFLEFCGIQSIHDLPESDIVPREKLNSWMQNDGLRETDRQLVLPLEDPNTEPLETNKTIT